MSPHRNNVAAVYKMADMTLYVTAAPCVPPKHTRRRNMRLETLNAKANLGHWPIKRNLAGYA